MDLEQMIKRYMITTAQANARVNHNLLENMEAFADKHDAEIVVLPTAGQTINDDMYHEALERYLRPGSFTLNKNVKVSDFQVRPQQINPLTGVKRFARGDSSSCFFLCLPMPMTGNENKLTQSPLS